MLKSNSHAGFTLVEVMISLFVVSVMTSVVLISFQSLYNAKETKQFLELLMQDIYFAQQLAITSGHMIDIHFNNFDSAYYIKQYGRTLYSQPYDKDITFERATLNLTDVRFNSRGSIVKPGTILIRTDSELYRIVFLLGKGRFYIEKV